MRIMLRRLRPDYPEISIREIDGTSKVESSRDVERRSPPAILVDGIIVTRRHLREWEMRRLLNGIGAAREGRGQASRDHTWPNGRA
jgi:hypothetical protein